MKINTALILCAGLGERLKPLTFKTPKPLLKLNNITILERCINMVIEFGAQKIYLNTFHLSNQIFKFIKNKKFSIDIEIINDGNEILDSGGGGGGTDDGDDGTPRINGSGGSGIVLVAYPT